jgi:hypothetical protein
MEFGFNISNQVFSWELLALEFVVWPDETFMLPDYSCWPKAPPTLKFISF